MLPPVLDAASGTLTLQWLAPSGSIDGFAVEARYGSAAYTQINTSLVPAATLTYSLALPATVAETTDCSFRAKALRGTDSSPYSNEVTYHKPLLGPGQPVGVYDWAQAGTTLSWSSASTKADGYLLKRAECTNSGSLVGPWVTLQSVTGTTTTCLDATAKLGTYYVYSVTNTKGTEASAESKPSAVVSTLVPAPSQLVATYDAARGGVALTWGTSFTYGDGILLERATADSGGNPSGAWTALTGPPAGATAFLDAQVHEATSYLYRISNVRGQVDSAPLALGASVAVPPATPSGLAATLVLTQGVPTLTWTSNSTGATAVRVERAEADTSGLPSKPWVTLTVPTGVFTSYTDLSAQEFTRYVYRVTNGFGATWGATSALSPSVTTPLATPSQVAATFDTATNAAKLTWTANTTKADHALVERAQLDANGLLAGTWTTLSSYATTTGYTDTNPGELTAYLYRVTNLASGVPSAASAPSAPISTPLAPPSYLSAYSNGSTALYVNWSSTYASNRTYILSRAESDSTGTPTSGWTSITVPTGYQSSVLDSGVTEGKAYVYRLAISLNGYTTPNRQTASPAQVPLSAPAQVVATPKAAGIDLAWVNRSTAATQVVIRRSGGSYSSYATDIASLPAGTTSYSDASLPLGTYTYQVVAKAGTVEASASAVTASTLNGAGSLALTATPLTVLRAVDAALLPSGNWAFAGQYPFGMLANPGDPWAAYYPDTTSVVGTTLVRSDASGNPHSVYLIPSTANPTHSIVRHLGYDGTAWQTEDLWEGLLSSSTGTNLFQFSLDTTGRPQAILNTSTNYYPTVGSLRHLHYTGSAWQCDAMSGASNASQSVNQMSFSLDGAGQPHPVLIIGTDAVEMVPNGSGGWVPGIISSEALSNSVAPFVHYAGADTANGWLFYTTANTSSYPYQVTLKGRQKIAGVWQTPVALGTTTQSYDEGGVRIGANADRSRIVVGFMTNVGLKVYHLASGSWHETFVPTLSLSTTWFRLGLDSADRLHVIVPASGSTATYTDYHE